MRFSALMMEILNFLNRQISLRKWGCVIWLCTFVITNFVMSEDALINTQLAPNEDSANQLQLTHFRNIPIEQQVVKDCYGGFKSDIVKCCKQYPSSFLCNLVRNVCQKKPHTFCPDCSTSSDKITCCNLNPGHSYCSVYSNCKKVNRSEVTHCCKVNVGKCKMLKHSCKGGYVHKFCPLDCGMSSDKYICCWLRTKALGCPVSCKTESEILECCHPFALGTVEPNCTNIRTVCKSNPSDTICPDCSVSADKFACCLINEKHSICSNLVDCKSAADVYTCCLAHPDSNHCQEIQKCYSRPGHLVCLTDCTNSWMKHRCCKLNPAARGCPSSDCSRELEAIDIIHCCHQNPYSDHCQKIRKTCSVTRDPICPDCLESENHHDVIVCCIFNPLHDTACSDADTGCLPSAFFDIILGVDCCSDFFYDPYCEELIKNCRSNTGESTWNCPSNCTSSNAKYFCCSINQTAIGCVTDCINEPDITECCRENPSFNLCVAIRSTCKNSSVDPVCPDCSVSSDRLYCCRVLNPTHNGCSDINLCTLHPDVSACCKPIASSEQCKDIANKCRKDPTDSICPRDCSVSSETYFCCTLNNQAQGCPKDCKGEMDVVECCKSFPEFLHCGKIKTECASLPISSICPNCSLSSDQSFCCEQLNPTHAACPNETKCKGVPDVPACCKVNAATPHCMEIINTCTADPKNPICPQDCTRSAEKNFCCTLNQEAKGCSTNCNGESDIVNCCKSFPSFPKCEEIKKICASSPIDPKCPNCYSSSDLDTCCVLNPKHLGCPTDCRPGR